MNEKKSILVIDDDITSLTAMRTILEKTFEVCLAKSADMAWSILNNTMIDLILLDVEMPAISGLDFMNYLRENAAFNCIPVIFVTSHGTADIIIKAKKSGAKGFMVKPVSAVTALEKINAVIKEAVPKTDRELLLKMLRLLDISCKTGKTSQAEKLAGELSKRRYNVGTNELMAIISREVHNLNYPVAVEKISELIKNNLFDIK